MKSKQQQKQKETKEKESDWIDFSVYPETILAAHAGSIVTRRCNKKTFEKLKRSMTTTDMISQIGTVIEDLFPAESDNNNNKIQANI